MPSLSELGHAIERIVKGKGKPVVQAEINGPRVKAGAVVAESILLTHVGRDGHSIITQAQGNADELPPFTLEASSHDGDEHLTSTLSNR